jgi:signal transduction histidine kinase
MLRYTRLEARRSVWDLRSKVLEEKGLSAALQAIAEGAAPKGPGIQVQATGEPRRLATGVEFHLLRIAQEATTNTIKHSGAATIRIAITILYHENPINPSKTCLGSPPLVSLPLRDGWRRSG